MSHIDFKTLTDKLQRNFDEIIKDVDCLFEVNVDKDELWNIYLDSYPAGSNEIFRERREYDCSACKSFIRNIGKAVMIKDNMIKTIWGFESGDSVYQTVLDCMDLYIKSKAVNNIYYSNNKTVGIHVNRELSDGKILEWHHLNVTLPSKLIADTSEGIYKNKYRDNRVTLQTSLDLISEESISIVLELIASNSLYRGNEWDSVLKQFLSMKQVYLQLPNNEINNWLWVTSFEVGAVISKIKNHSIGTLLQNITSEMDLELAIKKYEAIIAPENYKRPKPIFTKAMLEKAQQTVTDLGYHKSLSRRFATVDDVTIQDLLYVDRSVVEQNGVFDELANTISDNPVKYDKVDELGIEKFLEDIIPNVNEIEVMMENRHVTNLVSLIAPVNEDGKTMFKWENNFSWAYNGNMTDSAIKENVKEAGGNVTGDMRFSIQWNDIETDNNDLDAHCVEPNGNVIYYPNARSMSRNFGMLDVDIITPRSNVPAVENIVYSDRTKMQDGVYKLFVHNYSNRSGTSGFRAEIEFDGAIYSFDYTSALREGERVYVAEITVSNGEFSIKKLIDSELQTREVWGINVNKFVPVSLMCLSPNYWNGQIGNKHYMFILKDCINPDKPNGFFNEYLTNGLYEHRKVFEALGSKMRVIDDNNQLSGLGFSSTKNNSVVVRVRGNIDRVFKLKV